MSQNDLTRSVWRRVDVEQKLAAYVYTARAYGGTVDERAVAALCLAFGIDIADVAKRVRDVMGK